jgi:hypothetical protein
MSVIIAYAERPNGSDVLLLTASMDRLGRETVFLVPDWALERLVFSPAGSRVTVNSYASPVLEYSPPVDEDGQCLKVGRVYFGFPNTLEPAQKQDIDSVFTWIHSHSIAHRGCPTFRIFPSATKFPLLRGWVGKPTPNPHFKEAIDPS